MHENYQNSSDGDLSNILLLLPSTKSLVENLCFADPAELKKVFSGREVHQVRARAKKVLVLTVDSQNSQNDALKHKKREKTALITIH